MLEPYFPELPGYANDKVSLGNSWTNNRVLCQPRQSNWRSLGCRRLRMGWGGGAGSSFMNNIICNLPQPFHIFCFPQKSLVNFPLD